jgi:hypothetical protein
VALAQYKEWHGGKPPMFSGHHDCVNEAINSACDSFTKSTDNEDYEWCTAFVSWVYKVSGRSFTGGSPVGWLVPLLSNLSKQPGFTYHAVGSSYVPRLGDIDLWGSIHADIVVQSDGHNPVTVGGDEEGDGSPNTNIVDKIQYNSQTTECLSPN